MHVGSEPEIICSIIRIHHWNQCCRAGLFFTSSSFSLFAGSNKYPLLFASNYLEQIFIHTLTRNNSFIFKIFSLFAFDIDQCQKFGTKEEKSFQIFLFFIQAVTGPSTRLRTKCSGSGSVTFGTFTLSSPTAAVMALSEDSKVSFSLASPEQ